MIQLYTIGHSTRAIEEFIELLKAHKIELLIDVRTIPKSKYVPQYNIDALESSLEKEKIAYLHLAELGGLRHAKKDSINTGWKNASFRGYADYMQAPEFSRGLDMLLNLAERHTAAIMCAEAVPWKCHRSLIADALLARGAKVFHILSSAAAQPHKMTEFAKAENGKVWYPLPHKAG